ncbi:hypothetical protein BC830DRAFT_145747 [Chytriomyces sp. MP71]|nr:hypothetical protein BC830DRAFT_145747 [Chytriomyces sp. MP71]
MQACLLASLLIASVAAQAPTTNAKGCVNSYDASVDYFPEKINNSIPSVNLSYQYKNNYKIITDKLSGSTYVLYQCGTPKPDVAANRTIAVPVQTVSVADTTVVTYLELLGQRASIKYTSGGTVNYITSPCIQAQLAKDNTTIVDVPSKDNDQALAFLNSTGVTFTFGSYDVSASANNSVQFPATTDPGVLGRAEWLGFVASFFNQEAQANSLSNQIADNIKCLSSAANASAQADVTKRPVVAAVAYNAPYQGSKPSWVISAPKIYNDYITLAGGQPLVPKGVNGTAYAGGLQYSFATAADLLAALAPVDILFDDSFGDTNATDTYAAIGVSTTQQGTFKFISNKQIYSFNRLQASSGSTEWYESAVIEENVVLADLVAVINPALMTGYQTTFVRSVFGSAPVIETAADCPAKNYADALALPIVKCPAPIAPASATAAASKTGAAGVTAPAVAIVAAAFALFAIWMS